MSKGHVPDLMPRGIRARMFDHLADGPTYSHVVYQFPEETQPPAPRVSRWARLRCRVAMRWMGWRIAVALWIAPELDRDD